MVPALLTGFEAGQLLWSINPIALKTSKTLWSFGRSECNRVKEMDFQNFVFSQFSRWNCHCFCSVYVKYYVVGM